MDRERALELLRGGKEGVAEWNDYHARRGRPPNLTGVDLTGAFLRGVNLYGFHLNGANFFGADLHRANLARTILCDANLRGTMLGRANLSEANLRGANLRGARVAATVFNSNLESTRGLDRVSHDAPSVLSHAALRSLGRKWPEKFLRGCGLTPWETLSVKLHDLDLTPNEVADLQTRIFALRTDNPVQVRPVFMSYSHTDAPFVDGLQQRLCGAGINVWRDIHDAIAGPLEDIVNDAMRSRLVVLVLSEASTDSDWVEHEVRKAREIAKEQERDVLCPVAIDDSWKTCKWPERLRAQVQEYSILDFSGWQDPDTFNEQLRRLAAGIRKWY